MTMEMIITMEEINELASNVFGKYSLQWLMTPHLLLNNKTPYDLMNTGNGRELIRNMLYNIKYGGVV